MSEKISFLGIKKIFKILSMIKKRIDDIDNKEIEEMNAGYIQRIQKINADINKIKIAKRKRRLTVDERTNLAMLDLDKNFLFNLVQENISKERINSLWKTIAKKQ